MALIDGKQLLQYLQNVVSVIVLLKFARRCWKMGTVNALKDTFSALLTGTLNMPGLKAIVASQVDKEVRDIEENMLGDGDKCAILCIPSKSRSKQEVVDMMRELQAPEEFSSGKKWAGIYHHLGENEDSELETLQTEVWSMYNNSNSLYPAIFPSVRKYEAEIVQMCISMLNGRASGPNGNPNRKKDPTGLLTSGGTESILIAMLAYREQAKLKGVTQPEIICCRSAHGALDKACHYFNIKLVKLEPDATLQLNAAEVNAAITPNTCAVYCSAPSFPHGVVDDVEALAKVTRARGIGLHVDNCLGGFYLSFLAKHGLFKRKFDFQVEGVTSISIDVHKYGFAPKGVSVICFASNELRRHSLFPVADGLTLYVTPTLQGSRAGATMAAAWASILYHGQEGYSKSFQELHVMHKRVEKDLSGVEGLHLLNPEGSDLAIIPVASNRFDIFALASQLEERGWNMFTSRQPDSMALCVGQQHIQVIDTWLQDVKECCAFLIKHPATKPAGDAAVYGAAKMLPVGVLCDVLKGYVDVKMSVKKAI